MNDLPSLCYNLRLVCPSQTRPLALTVQIETAPSAAGLSPLSFLPNSNLMRGPDSIPAPSFSGSLAGYPIGVLTKSLFGDSLPARIVKVIAPTRRVHPRRRASFHPAPYSTRLPPSILRFHSQNPDGVCSLGTLPGGNSNYAVTFLRVPQRPSRLDSLAGSLPASFRYLFGYSLRVGWSSCCWHHKRRWFPVYP